MKQTEVRTGRVDLIVRGMTTDFAVVHTRDGVCRIGIPKSRWTRWWEVVRKGDTVTVEADYGDWKVSAFDGRAYANAVRPRLLAHVRVAAGG